MEKKRLAQTKRQTGVTGLFMATKLDLADAQFIGYAHGKREPGIIGLVEGMGLTKKEWEKWKLNYTSYTLTDAEVQEIDEHFNAN
jgi:hypothetical protein